MRGIPGEVQDPIDVALADLLSQLQLGTDELCPFDEGHAALLNPWTRDWRQLAILRPSVPQHLHSRDIGRKQGGPRFA
ncbi:hypothetical protein GCM10009799_32310 [Nocardiopsis rhodophaea]|uniref:Uncharacterized protein n=1 Tax=Nocardiopsis rhodophaea TaxID=280238 RepID=A0ABN2TBS3_9ACTN